MNMDDRIERHMRICEELTSLYERKNRDYGDAFHLSFVEEGMAMSRIRLGDKLNRFKQLSKNPGSQSVNDESIRDTLIDLANYAIMTVLELDHADEDKATSDETRNEVTVRYREENARLSYVEDVFHLDASRFTICDICKHRSQDEEEYPCEVCIHADGNLEYFTLDPSVVEG